MVKIKLLIKPEKYNKELLKYDGIILPLKDYSIEYKTYFSIEEIKKIRKEYKKEIFVVINRMIYNKDIEDLKYILKELDKLNLTGVFFYDLSILQLKKELKLKIDLVWNNTYMVTNYKTCDYYYKKGVKYAYISKEITFKEVLEIYKNSKIIPMFNMIGYSPVASSKRKLLTNYLTINNKEKKDVLTIQEKITKEEYLVEENKYGTTFMYNKIINNVEKLEKLKEIDFPYLIFIEDRIEHNKFMKCLEIVRNNIDKNTSLEEVYKLIGNNNGFLNKKTIYKVKKNG